MQDYFHKKADTWDSGDIRVDGAKKIADAISKEIRLTKEMEILDFGVGTGLLGFEIAKTTKKVYGVDTSKTMLKKLEEKNTTQLNIKTYCQDITKEPINKVFDGVISSMTLHHVQDLKAFFDTIYQNITKDGFIAIADLETEDGSFHSDNKGVFHFGFDEESLRKIVEEAGFLDVKFKNINRINKPEKNFGVFLLTAKK